jgi:adenylylsulfate kinase-like enzyme
MNRRSLVLISGPIAAGKTTTAEHLAAVVRAENRRAMALDMDGMIAMTAGSDWSVITAEDRRLASRLTGTLVQAAFDAGVEVVVVAGSTLSSYEWDDVTAGLSLQPETTYVLLSVSLDESIRRARNDPGRVATRNATHVTRLAAAIDWTEVRKPDVEVETDGMSVDEVVRLLRERLLLTPRRRGEAS